MTAKTSTPALADFALTTTDYTEFRNKACLVPVSIGPGLPGNTHWKCHSNYEQPDADGALRLFIENCAVYDEYTRGQTLTAAERSDFVTASVLNLLSGSTRIDPVMYFIGPNNTCLILYRGDSGPLVGIDRETIIGLTWHLEQDFIEATEHSEGSVKSLPVPCPPADTQ